ncbi:MAG: PP2C family protein-serine/threonine phosphatase [Phycisphaerales bacterium]
MTPPSLPAPASSEAPGAPADPLAPAREPAPPSPGPDRPWRERLDHLVDTMREVSLHADPQQMVEAYANRMRGYFRYDRLVSVSRRELAWPNVRITRSTTWKQTLDPWRQRDRLPTIKGGLIADLIYGDEPRIINDFTVAPDDPGFEYLQGMRSIMAIPHYDTGVGLNMVLTMRSQPDAFDPERFPEIFWMSNLFGRMAGGLAVSRQLREATGVIERELRVVADIQRSLLPVNLPRLATLELAAYYQTSKNAGGDYYDFFDLGDGRLGILIADVAGHGTPAAVLMAILHAIAHLAPVQESSPAATLEFINRHLSPRYTGDGGTFVTAFYAVYDQATRLLTYSSAGHPHPLVATRARPGVQALDRAQGLPLGIDTTSAYSQAEHQLSAGDTLVLYTDGITEAREPGGRMYGEARLGGNVACCPSTTDPQCPAEARLNAILEDIRTFAAGHPANDDRTLVVARIT